MRSISYIVVLISLLVLFSACSHYHNITAPARISNLSGTAFYKTASSYTWAQRDSFVLDLIDKGDIPSFLLKFVAINMTVYDSLKNKKISLTYFVSQDYLSIGNDEDWARVNITPMAAQKIADRLNCFLPTRKMVNDIYKNAEVILEPVPMYAFRDSTPTMYQHHLIIEGQRRGRKGLIAGIMKDIVVTSRLKDKTKQDRVAIYGWHMPDGKPIQPLYLGHINWYVDYSHGIRLIYNKIKINGKWVNYQDVFNNADLQKVLCDEADCSLYRYPY